MPNLSDLTIAEVDAIIGDAPTKNGFRSSWTDVEGSAAFHNLLARAEKNRESAYNRGYWDGGQDMRTFYTPQINTLKASLGFEVSQRAKAELAIDTLKKANKLLWVSFGLMMTGWLIAILTIWLRR